METKQLARLAAVASLLKFDISPGTVTLIPLEGGTEAWYCGTYTTGIVRVADITNLTEPVTVPTEEFAALVKLVSAPSVIVRPTERSLVLATGDQRLTLRQHGERVLIDRWLLSEPLAIRVNRKTLAAEAAIAAGVASSNYSTPVLTGTHLLLADGRLKVEAMNGVSIAYSSSVPAEGSEFEALPPAADFATALKLFEDDEIQLAVPSRGRGSLLLRDSHTTVRMAVLSGKWPDMSRLKVEPIDNLAIDGAVLKRAAQAIRIYDVYPELTFRPNGENTRIVSRPAQGGQFEALVPGVIKNRYTVSSADLDSAAHALDGTLRCALSGSFARVVGDRPEQVFYLNMRIAQ